MLFPVSHSSSAKNSYYFTGPKPGEAFPAFNFRGYSKDFA